MRLTNASSTLFNSYKQWRTMMTLSPSVCKGMHNNENKTRVFTELEEFEELFPELVEVLVTPGLNDPERKEAFLWFKEVLEYNVPFGIKNRGMSVVMAYKHLVTSPTEEELRTARILGWCIEFLQASFVVADDLMDQSYTRRGKPCWFRKGNVGLEAVNDALYIEACIYRILKHYIRDKPYYMNIVELFHEITHASVTGQCLDMTVSPPRGTIDFTNYTIDKYNAIGKWKTAFYSFYLPAAVAMYMVNINDEESHSRARAILLKVGHFFQAQNDFLDCYGDEVAFGKIGTDIEGNKCSWLVIQAIKMATPEQLQALKDNYGSSDESKVAAVKKLYKDLKVQQAFRDFEEQSFSEVMKLIEELSGELPKEMFEAFVQKMYSRNE